MRVVTLPFAILTANSTTTAGWSPIDRTYRVVGFAHALFAVELQGLGSLQARPGYQYSADGITWSTPIPVDLTSGAAYATAAGWTYGDAVVSLETGQTPLQYIRFGLLAVNTTGTRCEMAQARLSVELRAIPGGTVSLGPVVVNTRGSTTLEVFTPVGDPMLTIGIVSLRAIEVGLGGGSGDIQIQPAYQLSDDGLTWSDEDELGAWVTSPGIDDNHTFLTPTPGFTKQYIRFGFRAKNVSGSGVDACWGTLRIDWRSV